MATLDRKERNAAYYRANRERLLAKSNDRVLTPEQRERKNKRERQAYREAGEAARLVARSKQRARRAADPALSARDEAQRDPVKRRAKQLVRNALRRGELIRQPCEVCGRPDAQAHHDDYAQPLVVRWLCSIHHGQQHRRND